MPTACEEFRAAGHKTAVLACACAHTASVMRGEPSCLVAHGVPSSFVKTALASYLSLSDKQSTPFQLDLTMTNFFYFDQNNKKLGPVSEQQLKELAAQGRITPHTQMETDTGHTGVAGQIPGMTFGTAAPNPFSASTSRVPPTTSPTPELNTPKNKKKNELEKLLDEHVERYPVGSCSGGLLCGVIGAAVNPPFFIAGFILGVWLGAMIEKSIRKK